MVTGEYRHPPKEIYEMWKEIQMMLQIHMNFPRFLPIFPDFLE
jgi:hypothetical protein